MQTPSPNNNSIFIPLTAIIIGGICLSGCLPKWLAINNKPATKSKIKDTCLTGNCLDGQGTLQFTDGRRYQGSFLAGRPGGYGTIFLPSGSEYDGNFRHGKYSGQGDILFADGSGAECESGNCINGQGTILYEDGSRYSGQFQNEIKEGMGTTHLEDINAGRDGSDDLPPIPNILKYDGVMVIFIKL